MVSRRHVLVTTLALPFVFVILATVRLGDLPQRPQRPSFLRHAETCHVLSFLAEYREVLFAPRLLPAYRHGPASRPSEWHPSASRRFCVSHWSLVVEADPRIALHAIQARLPGVLGFVPQLLGKAKITQCLPYPEHILPIVPVVGVDADDPLIGVLGLRVVSVRCDFR